jgi:hypothetical protein
MSAFSRWRFCFGGMLVLVAFSMLCDKAQADNLILADGKAFPGQLWQSRNGGAERSVFRLNATPNPAYPRAAMKIGHVAVGSDGKIYFASGLDGYVMHLLDGNSEVVSFEFGDQVRDLDCGNEAHTVYFSVVPTPQNNEPLADGTIYRRDLWAGQPSEAATVRQSQIGGNWWGTFAIQDGSTYLATLDNPSRLFKLTSSGPEQVFPANQFKIQGLASTADGKFLFSDGTGNIYSTSDFENVEVVLKGSQKFTDVAAEPNQAASGR